MIGITLIIFIRMDRPHMQSKMDRNHTCKLLFENCMDCILHDCCVCNVHGIIGPGYMLYKRIIHMASHWKRSDSVVECLTRDRGAAGSSLTGALRCGH